ncbi:MAG: HlyD family secretion protein, partial [Opitutaceae bacterium]
LGVLICAAAIAAAFWPRNRTLVLTGMVTTDEIIVSSQIEGRLGRLLVKEGDQVARGELLGEIQPPEYRADVAYYKDTANAAEAAVAQAEADLRFQTSQVAAEIAQARANLAASRAQAQAAAADLENARLSYRRQKELRTKGANSQQDYDQARTAWDGSRARADSANHQTAAAESALRLAQADADQLAVREAALKAARDQAAGAAAQSEKARVILGYTEIRAPIPGIVDVRAALQGEVVNPGQAIVTLINPNNLWVRADVAETYIDRIRLGEKLMVRLPSGAERMGTVFYRAVDADYATQRDVSRTKRDIRTFQIRLRCDNSDRALAVGMTAYVTLPLGRS